VRLLRGAKPSEVVARSRKVTVHHDGIVCVRMRDDDMTFHFFIRFFFDWKKSDLDHHKKISSRSTAVINSCHHAFIALHGEECSRRGALHCGAAVAHGAAILRGSPNADTNIDYLGGVIRGGAPRIRNNLLLLGARRDRDPNWLAGVHHERGEPAPEPVLRLAPRPPRGFSADRADGGGLRRWLPRARRGDGPPNAAAR
jgi:hypothetical protein